MKLKPESLDWSLKNSGKIDPLIDLFPKAFEFEAIKDDWKNIKHEILKINFPKGWNIRESRKMFAPKHQFGFRLCTQLDPIDAIIYKAIVYEIGDDLEKSRVEKDLEINFSYRFNPSEDGGFWDENYTYKHFEDKTLEIIDSGKYEYIILADIADYFPRIYSHVLENSLLRATSMKEHIYSLKKLMKSLYQNVSYGIPVGNDASFLLAETMINSIDLRLIDEKVKFCRYIDDFRIFDKDKIEAYNHLNLLSEIIFNNLGLTLQQHKTKILPTDQYIKIRNEKPDPTQPLSERFIRFIEEEIEFHGVYQIIDIENLSTELEIKLNEFEFDKIIEEQMALENSNIYLIRFILNTLAQTDNPIVIQNILNNIEKFYPVMNTLVLYFSNLTNLNPLLKKDIGEQFIEILKNSYLGHSKFNRMWILNLFAQSSEWGGESEFIDLYKRFTDEFTRRKLIIALGRAKKDFWFTAERKKFPSEFTSWQKRAFLRAYSCVQEDEKFHWYKSIRKNKKLDYLDKAIIKWVKKNPL